MKSKASGFTPEDIKIIDKKTAYRGYFRLEKYRFRHRLFAGGWSDVVTHEIFERGHAAGVLLYDPISDQVVLLEQLRIAALQTQTNPWLIELVAGKLDKPNESPDQAVMRESQEEAGMKVKALVPISSYLVSPGGTTETIALFCGKVNASQAAGIHGVSEEHEDIRVLVWDALDAFAAVTSGKINNAMAIIALQWLQLNHQQLRHEWGEEVA